MISMLEGFTVSAEMVKSHLQHGEPVTLVELRHHYTHDWSLFKARGAIRLELGELKDHVGEIPANQPVVLFSDCPGDETSVKAARILQDGGVKDVHKLAGGFDAYLEAGLPVESVSRTISATRIMML
jgi:rhodanese-related sulfurtransferase